MKEEHKNLLRHGDEVYVMRRKSFPTAVKAKYQGQNPSHIDPVKRTGKPLIVPVKQKTSVTFIRFVNGDDGLEALVASWQGQLMLIEPHHIAIKSIYDETHGEN